MHFGIAGVERDSLPTGGNGLAKQSFIAQGGTEIFTMPEWLAKDKGLI